MGFLMRFYNENNKSDRLNDLKVGKCEKFLIDIFDFTTY